MIAYYIEAKRKSLLYSTCEAGVGIRQSSETEKSVVYECIDRYKECGG